ncbi:hypothetical protein AALC16_10250 [Lachnospiraceae bacterium 29-91]
MMFAKRKIYIVILISCLTGCLFGIHASASEAVPEGLPEIVRWECGGGYDRDGNRIIGAWAYDTVNEAGRYVLFDGNGMVQKKADNWETRNQVEEYYTPTEQDSGTIALRSERFPGFDGEIYVTIGYENGVTRKFDCLSRTCMSIMFRLPRVYIVSRMWKRQIQSISILWTIQRKSCRWRKMG